MVLLGVDLGLGVGVAFAVYTVIVRTQHPKSSVLGRIPGTDIYRDMQYYQMVSLMLLEIDIGLGVRVAYAVYCIMSGHKTSKAQLRNVH